MPAAIPLAITAAGAVASRVGKSKQEKQQNKNNQAADDKYNAVNQGFGNKMSGIGDENRAQNQGLFNSIMGGAGQLWNQAGSQSQPSAGSGSFHNPYMSESQPFYKKAMDTGLFDQGQMNDFRNRGAIQNDALFAGLKRRLDQGANVRGGNFAGYSGQSALLGRDAARQGEENRLNTESSLQDMIRQNMFGGAQGVTGNDNTYQAALRDVDSKRNQFSLASAALEGQGLDRQFGQQSDILQMLQGLRTQGTNDMPYYGQAGDAYRGYRATPEQAGQPWYGAVGDAAQGIGSGLLSSGYGQGGQQTLQGQRGILQGRAQMPQVQQMPTSNRRFNSLG
jgi:hypothetical protein